MTDVFHDLPRDHFGVIYADPPWHFRAYSKDAGGAPHRTSDNPYATVEVSEMMEWPVADLAAKDCALIMWVIGSHLNQALRLGETWGFRYVTDLFTWVKTGKNDPAVRPIGMGYWSRKGVEQALLFTRGSPKRLDAGVRQLIEADDHLIHTPKREHSRKPDEAYGRIERLLDGPYLELFARTERPGWSAWGNEVGRFSTARSTVAAYDDLF